MKLLTLLLLPVSLNALREFKDKFELTKCVETCNELITPCIKKQDCMKVYVKCIDDKDPFTCLSSSNHVLVPKIVDCFDTKCEQRKIVIAPTIEGQSIEKQDAEEMAQFQKSNTKKKTQEMQNKPSSINGKDGAQPGEWKPSFYKFEEKKAPELQKGRVIKLDENGDAINEDIPKIIIHPGKQAEKEDKKEDKKQNKKQSKNEDKKEQPNKQKEEQIKQSL